MGELYRIRYIVSTVFGRFATSYDISGKKKPALGGLIVMFVLFGYSKRSFSFAASLVCHCILPAASAPPRLSGTTWSIT